MCVKHPTTVTETKRKAANDIIPDLD